MLLRALCVLLLLALPFRAGELRLMMVEEAGCAWCARWNAEIAPAYPRSSEGQVAPLFRVDLKAPLTEGVIIDRPASFTPTFILLSDGTETGRIEGYPGADFFWPMLDALIRSAQVPANRE
ncbi:hypothetical protein [Rhodobacter maris]|uniref:Thioredoxin-like protein n=1 Tax=Rhodobacter maris TaxID=446682 RepID=A0A285TAK4_9RHOB|nr:hypothetical protein [Rhodobacter maris]SOC18418.1 hypothetical protein SAMN05877831_11659 [Rhodobacter maris]